MRESPPSPAPPQGEGGRWPAPPAPPARRPDEPAFVPLARLDEPVPGDAWRPLGDEPATAFPVPWRWWEAVLVFLLIQVMAFVVVVAAVEVVGEDTLYPVGVIAGGGLTIVLTLLWVRLRHPGQVRRLFGPVRISWSDLGRGVGIGILSYLVVNVALSALITTIVERSGNELPEVQQGLQDALVDPAAGLVVAFAVVVLAPLGEELLFRGLLFSALRNRVPLWPAIGTSGLLFALSHGEALAIVLLFPIGMYFAWAYHRRGSLAVTIVAHAVFNLINVVGLRLSLIT